MADGDILLDSDGNRILDAFGVTQLSAGSDNCGLPCCMDCCTTWNITISDGTSGALTSDGGCFAGNDFDPTFYGILEVLCPIPAVHADGAYYWLNMGPTNDVNRFYCPVKNNPDCPPTDPTKWIPWGPTTATVTSISCS